MHYSITLRCLLMIALFIYFLFASSSYFELFNPLFWCRTIFNNPDLLRWAGLTKICSFYWAPVAASVLTPNVFILLFFWDDRGSLRTASRLLGLGCELWDVNVPITRSSAEHAEKEKRGISLCGQRMSKSKFAPGQESMLLQQAWVKCARVLGSGGFVPFCRC